MVQEKVNGKRYEFAQKNWILKNFFEEWMMEETLKGISSLKDS